MKKVIKIGGINRDKAVPKLEKLRDRCLKNISDYKDTIEDQFDKLIKIVDDMDDTEAEKLKITEYKIEQEIEDNLKMLDGLDDFVGVIEKIIGSVK